MSSLTAEQLTVIRTDLEAARAALLVQADALARSDAELVTARASQEERAKSQGDADLLGVERNVVARTSQVMQDGLAELEAALARLDAGTFGTCVRCAGQIPAERLMARPRAATCVRCAASR